MCAEYDVLPEIGHGCGHNLIAVSSIAAFSGIVAALRIFPKPGRARVIGCPAEEGGGRKLKLIRAGAFADVDAAMMIHPTPPTQRSPKRKWRESPMGLVLPPPAFWLSFTGKPAHAAATMGRNQCSRRGGPLLYCDRNAQTLLSNVFFRCRYEAIPVLQLVPSVRASRCSCPPP